jgi:hypothetical protein
MATHQTDEGVLHRIRALAEEERTLFDDTNRDDHGHVRLEEIRVELDQCWDLLRQRRALREFGEDPDKASVRPSAVVEKYEQ